MNKRTNTYRIKLEEASLKHPENKLKTLEFSFENHDDIFKIIDVVKSKSLFDEEGHSAEFALGLKLFSEVVLRNRKHSLFEELGPALGDFMKKLKSQ